MSEKSQDLLAEANWAELIKTAISRVPNDWLAQYPIDWILENCSYNEIKKLKPKLQQYNERDWCYEFYHQLRNVIEQCEYKEQINEHKIRLSGEPSKSATHEYLSINQPWTANKRLRIPDILFHNPETVDSQIFAIEIKRAGIARKVGPKEISQDLQALREYVVGLGFLRGFFMGVGITMAEFDQAMELANQNDELSDLRVCRQSLNIGESVHVVLAEIQRHVFHAELHRHKTPGPEIEWH